MRIVILATASLLLALPAQALTFKSDGSVVQADGTVTQKSAEDRYLEALSAFRAGEEVTGFPIARETSGFLGLGGGRNTAPSGYFGSDIVEEGAPLIPLPKSIDISDPIASIADNLGMSAQQFTASLVATASEDWLEDNGIDPEVVPSFEQTVDTFLAADAQVDLLEEEGLVGINATGLTAQEVRDGELDALLEDPEALLEAAPVLIGAPIEVQRAFQARAQSKIAEANGLDISDFDAVELNFDDVDFDESDFEALARAAQEETERLIAEGTYAINGTELTVEDVLAGRLDESIGIPTAIVNASEEVYAAYEERLTQKLAEEQGISFAQLDFVNQAVNAAGVSSAEEAGRIAAQAAAEFNENAGAEAFQQASRAAAEAEDLANLADELQQIAIEKGTEEALRAAEEAGRAAELAADAARVAGEAAQAASGAVARSAEEAAWEAASAQAYDQAISAARAAGKSAEQAAAEAAEAAAAAGQAAFEAASIAAGRSAEEAAQDAAAEAAEQSALRELESKLESGEITPEEFHDAIQNVPDGA